MAITSWGGGNSSDNLRRSVLHNNNGGVAQMVERSLSMREVPGSIPGASNKNCFVLNHSVLVILLFFRRHETSNVKVERSSNESRRSKEDNMAIIFMGFILVFLICHLPRLLLNIHELVTVQVGRPMH